MEIKYTFIFTGGYACTHQKRYHKDSNNVPMLSVGNPDAVKKVQTPKNRSQVENNILMPSLTNHACSASLCSLRN
jgi:hypothetical protein